MHTKKGVIRASGTILKGLQKKSAIKNNKTDAVSHKIKISAKMHGEQNVKILNKDKIHGQGWDHARWVRFCLFSPNVDIPFKVDLHIYFLH